jgi:2-oxoglutarate dehydrogenase E1 component
MIYLLKDLKKEERYNNYLILKDIAIVTLEQVAPFPYKELSKHLKLFENAELFWVQEEHMNQGAWTYVKPRIKGTLYAMEQPKRAFVNYIGRRPSSASATGHIDIHEKELRTFLSQAFN